MNLVELQKEAHASFWHLLDRSLSVFGDPLFDYGCRLLHAYQTCEEAGHRVSRWLQHGVGWVLFAVGNRLKLRATGCMVRLMKANEGVWRCAWVA